MQSFARSEDESARELFSRCDLLNVQSRSLPLPRVGSLQWYQSRLSRFHATYGQKCAGMSTGAWSQMPPACGRARVGADARASRMRRHWTHGRGTGTVGTGRTDVAHGTVSTRRMGRGQERRSWWYLGWSGTRRGRRVLRGDDCNRTGQMPVGPGYCSDMLL